MAWPRRAVPLTRSQVGLTIEYSTCLSGGLTTLGFSLKDFSSKASWHEKANHRSHFWNFPLDNLVLYCGATYSLDGFPVQRTTKCRGLVGRCNGSFIFCERPCNALLGNPCIQIRCSTDFDARCVWSFYSEKLSNGLRRAIPRPSKSFMLRVTKTAVRESAIPAI